MPDEYVIVEKQSLNSIGDTIRKLTGSTDSVAVVDLGNKLVESVNAGEDNTVLDALIQRTINGSYTNDRVTSIGDSAFCDCTGLESVSAQNVESIGEGAFDGCNNITDISFPKAKYISQYAFRNCTSLTSICFPEVTEIGGDSLLS